MVVCAHVLWMVLKDYVVSLMLLKGFLIDSFIYFMSDENFK